MGRLLIARKYGSRFGEPIIGSALCCNTGDWVESCTALVEHYDGKLEVISCAHGQSIRREWGSVEISRGDGFPASSVGSSWFCHLRDEVEDIGA